MITLAPWLSFVPSFLITAPDDFHVFVSFVIRF
jgi:hypothetical protein